MNSPASSRNGRRAFDIESPGLGQFRSGTIKRSIVQPPRIEQPASLHADTIPSIAKALEESLGALGDLEPRLVLGRASGQFIDGKIVQWPWNTLGTQRLVRRRGGALFVTQGLSYPYDASVHGQSLETLGYELAFELGRAEPWGSTTVASRSNDELAGSWVVAALWALSGAYLTDRWPLLSEIDTLGAICAIMPPVRGLEHLCLPSGGVGLLAGAPLGPGPVGREGQHLLASVDGHESRLVTMKVLTPDEYAWATEVDDSSRAVELVQAFRRRGDAHLSSLTRPSVLTSPTAW